MIYMGIPADEKILAAIGRIAIRHGQMDYHLKMTVRALEDLSIPEALDATVRLSSRDLRLRIQRVATKRFGKGDTFDRLDHLLVRSKVASDERNRLLHSLWAHELDGAPVIRDQGNEFGPIPELAELDAVANGLAEIALDLLLARTEGFLKHAIVAADETGSATLRLPA